MRKIAILLGLVALALSACGGDGGDDGGKPAAESSANLDGSWSGTTTSAGSINFTVSHKKITSYKLESGANPFGPGCSQHGGSNQVTDAKIRIVDGQFSWGGEGKGWPVKGKFDSATSASGTAEFSPDLVGGKVPQGCAATNSATWKATKASH
jgi:hypothetical protein